MEAWNYRALLQRLKYDPHPHQSLDMWQVEGSDDNTIVEGVVSSENLSEWLVDEYREMPTPVTWRFRMLYLVEYAVDGLVFNASKWSQPDFEKLMTHWKLPSQYPETIWLGSGDFIALPALGTKGSDNERSNYVFSTSAFFVPFVAFCVSYCPSTKTTSVIASQGIPKRGDYYEYLSLERSKDYLTTCTSRLAHPLLLPIHHLNMLASEALRDYSRFRSELVGIERKTGHDQWKTPDGNFNPFEINFREVSGELHYLGIRVQDRLGELQSRILQLDQIRSSLLELEQQGGTSQDSQLKQISELLMSEVKRLSASTKTDIAHCNMLAGRVQIQLQVVYNYMAQRDNRLNLEIARDSKAVALASKRDSSSMKTIAVLTMVFLPATFVSSFFAMPFFSIPETKPSPSLRVHRQFWIYCVITIPLTLAVLGVWFVWMWFKIRRHDKEDVEAGVNLDYGKGQTANWKKMMWLGKQEKKEAKED